MRTSWRGQPSSERYPVGGPPGNEIREGYDVSPSGVENVLNDLRDSVLVMNDAVDQADSELNSWKSKVARDYRTIADDGTRRVAVDDRFDQLETQLQSDVTSLESDVTSLESDVILRAKQSEVDSLKERLDALERDTIKNNAKVRFVNERAHATSGDDPAYLNSASKSNVGTGWSGGGSAIRWNIQKI